MPGVLGLVPLLMKPPFLSPRPWSPERPDTLVVFCSDGRYRLHLIDFVAAKVSQRPDLYALPGGPAAIDPWASSFDHARVFDGSLRLLLSSREYRAIWLVAHHDCSFYKHRHGALSHRELRERQIRDLESGRRRLREAWPALEVHCVYASLEGEGVLFETVLEG